jgi:LCP family protein required for cell wall assembly
MKKSVIWIILGVLLFLGMLTSLVFASVTLVQLDMLPTGYLVGLLIFLGLFALLIGLMMFLKGKKPGKARRVIAAVLAVMLLCGCVVISTVASDVRKTIQAMSREMFELPTREIYVLADSAAQDVKDTAGLTFGYLKEYDEACTTQVLNRIREEIGKDPVTAGYVSIGTMIQALLDNRIDAIVLNGGIVSILEDTEEFMDFSGKTKVLEQFRVEEPELPLGDYTLHSEESVSPGENIYVEEEETEPQKEAIDFSALEPFIVYVSGSDSYDTQIIKSGRSDVNILAVVNPLSKQVLLLNTPRDYYVENPAGKGELDKLTHCGLYGIKNSMRTLGSLYRKNVDYYVRINFSGFKQMIDALGGVTVYSDYAFTAITRTEIAEGENHLNGQQALDFARERYTLPGGDAERGRHQMQVITAVIEKATTGTTIISNYSDIMDSVEGMFTMNVPAELISELMKMQLEDMARWNIVSFSVTGSGKKAETYSMPGMELYVTEPNEYSIKKAIRLIDMVYAGERLTEEVINSIT